MAESLLSQRVDAIRRLARRGAVTALAKVVSKARAEDLAASMLHLQPAEQRLVFAQIRDDAVAAKVLASVEASEFLDLVRDLSHERLAQLLRRLAPDDQTDAVERLEPEARTAVLQLLQGEDRAQVEKLLAYPPDTAGGIMSPLAFRLQEDCSCGDAIAAVQAISGKAQVHYIYVEDENGVLSGTLSLRSLLTHPPGTRLAEFMSRDVLTVTPLTDQEEVARIAGHYGLLAVPVVDAQRHLIGIITVDDVMDVLREEAAEDLLKMAGVSAPEGGRLRTLARRLPWLCFTLLGGLLLSLGIHWFFGLDSAAARVLGFLPVVMGLEGNIAVQSATLSVRHISTGRMEGRLLASLAEELAVGLLFGALFGGVIGAFIVLNLGLPSLGTTVALGVAAGTAVAALLGSTVPLVLRRFGLDPAIATSPLVVALADLAGVGLYLAVAAWRAQV